MLNTNFPQMCPLRFQFDCFPNTPEPENHRLSKSPQDVSCASPDPLLMRKSLDFSISKQNKIEKTKYAAQKSATPPAKKMHIGSDSVLSVDIATKQCPKVICVGFKNQKYLTNYHKYICQMPNIAQ